MARRRREPVPQRVREHFAYKAAFGIGAVLAVICVVWAIAALVTGRPIEMPVWAMGAGGLILVGSGWAGLRMPPEDE